LLVSLLLNGTSAWFRLLMPRIVKIKQLPRVKTIWNKQVYTTKINGQKPRSCIQKDDNYKEYANGENLSENYWNSGNKTCT